MVDFLQYPMFLNPTKTELASLTTSPYVLMFKLINFYSQLKISNHKVSNNKISCPVSITWGCKLKTEGIHSINCRQANALLKLLYQDKTGAGLVIRYSANFLQRVKFYKQQNRKQLSVINPEKVPIKNPFV